MPAFGVEFVSRDDPCDLSVGHAGAISNPGVLVCHGLYWTADYPQQAWQMQANAVIIDAARVAKIVTVPSAWVAESFQRDMRISPLVVGHGIDWADWQKPAECAGYVLWNKNRNVDVCDPESVGILAQAFPQTRFVTTFEPRSGKTVNMEVTGVLAHEVMKRRIQSAGVYLSTTKETFGIGILEAMCGGVPVLGWAQGGIVDLIQHGVDGYLASPGNWEDLAQGLAYCLEHRKTLGENGRLRAKNWTWEKACERAYAAWEFAIKTPDTETIGVVIPCYNYGTDAKLGRAIRSVLSQTRKPDKIVVVDDGSKEGNAEKVVKSFDAPITFIKKPNGGVATARNAGIEQCLTTYIACLDADDEMAPRFLEVCVSAMKDKLVGVSYTRLLAINEKTGEEKVSPWPDGYDFERQMQRGNQVPTCCLFRRKLWERLGGYRQRYAPHGAGAEDAEFFLRIGAIGYRGQFIDGEPLFRYHVGEGRVFGNREYREVDWTSWHPWVKDNKHPFASVARPKRQSHPVRQYDEPVVSVVIPVGPGHKEKLIDALDSLEAQTFRQWEAIVVWDGYKESEWFDSFKKSYPYIRELGTPSLGPGAARNAGVKIARAPLILYLDADDYLVPETIEKMVQVYHETQAAVYSDHIGMAYIDDPNQLDPRLRERIYQRDDDNWTVMGYVNAEYDCPRAQHQPDLERPYIWNLITTLFPKEWHYEIGGFDETMTTWEDVDYWWRMARRGKCFIKIPEELVVYRFYTGHRRELGVSLQQDRAKYVEAMGYIASKYEGSEIMACSSCGQKAAIPAPPSMSPEMRMLPRQVVQEQINDDDFVMARYMSLQRGAHRVIGPSGIDYGYRSGGEEFLVHKSDLQVAANKFMAVSEKQPVMTARIENTPPPEPLVKQVFSDRPLSEVSLPGVGPELAKQLQSEFATVKDFIGADEASLVEMLGSKRKVKTLMTYLRDKIN